MRNLGGLCAVACCLLALLATSALAQDGGKTSMKHAVEYLVFEMAPEHRDAFIEFDDQIWTPALAKQEGFVSKEVWIDENRPNQVTLVTYWSSYALWKAIPHSELAATDAQFKKAFGHPFELVKELHKTHRWFRIKETHDQKAGPKTPAAKNP